jgi:PilZ domain
MLDISHERSLIADVWDTLEQKARLPVDEVEFLALKGPTPRVYENQRSYHRFFLRGKALLKRNQTLLGVFTTDVSRRGIGFLAPVQLLPKEKINMHVPGAKELQLEVARCHRVDDACFECGAKFVLTS